MRKTNINLQDLRRKIYIKAKTEKSWRFWGIYVHVCKLEVLETSYMQAKQNNGAPGIDGVTFADIESAGRTKFLEELRHELLTKTYKPIGHRKHEIPKGDGKKRTLSIPSIRDRVVQGALKLILEAIFEADFQEGSYGYRPKRTAGDAVEKVSVAVASNKTRVIDLDLQSYFNTVRHDILLRQIAKRVNDNDIMRLVKQILKSGGKRGVPQGGPLSPLLSNIYLNEVDKMLEKAKSVTTEGDYTHIEYARFADDVVVLINSTQKWEWLARGVYKRLGEELSKLGLTLNAEKTRIVDLKTTGSFNFLGFTFKRIRNKSGKWVVNKTPKMASRTKLLASLKEKFRRYRSQPVSRIIDKINPILRGWANYFRIGNSVRCFSYVRDWVEKKVRRHLMQSRGKQGFGWARWSRTWLYEFLGLYNDYKIRYYRTSKVSSVR